MKKLITVVIPTYNRASLIEKAIESVLNQTYTDIELLVIDDYSTDNTQEIVNDFKDSRIKYMLNERTKGAQGARNTGILKANGGWIAFLDSDDYWLEEKLEIQITSMLEQKKVFSHTNWYIRDKHKTTINNKRISNILKTNYIGTFSSVVMSNELIAKIGLLDESLESCQDWDYWIRACQFTSPLYIDLPLLFYVKYSIDNISKNASNRIWGRKGIFEKYKSQIQSEGVGYSHKYDLAAISSDFSLFKEAFNEKKSLYQVFRYIYHAHLKKLINFN